MAIIKRINPKTNEIEFRVRFLWKDADGNRKDSKTGWFVSIEEAESEAKKLKFLREKDARTEYANRKEQTVEYVFGSIWIPELRSKAFRETTENTTTEHSLWKKASSLFNKYISGFFRDESSRHFLQTNSDVAIGGLTSLSQQTELINSMIRNCSSELEKKYKDLGYEQQINDFLSFKVVK